MGKYRRRIEIVADMLRTVTNGARKTRIMYQCNLSFKLLEQYLRDVLKAGLVCAEDTCNGYVITEKGKQFLERFESYVESFELLNHQSEQVDREREFLESMISGKDQFKPL